MTYYLNPSARYCSDYYRKQGAKQGISRRGFLQNATAAASCLALTLGGTERIFAANREIGEVRLDAMLVTYFSASAGGTDVPSWSLKGEYSQTIRLKLMEFPDAKLSPKITQQDNRILAGHRIWQTPSSQVSRGLVMQHKGFDDTTFGFGREGDAHTSDDTIFFSILRPKLRITATAKKLRFAFTDEPSMNGGGALIFPRVDELRNGTLENLISKETADSWLPNYITSRDALVKPRFKLRQETGSVSAGIQIPVKLTADGDAQFSAERTATTTSRIIEQTGFQSQELKDMFAVGNHLEITHSSVQEIETDKVVRMETDLTRAVPGQSEIYWDSLFKTFLIIDASA